MSSQIEAIIKAAESYIGVKESPPNSNNVLFNTWFLEDMKAEFLAEQSRSLFD